MNKIFVQASAKDKDMPLQFMFLEQIRKDLYYRIDMETPREDASLYSESEFFGGMWGETLRSFKLELIYD